MKRVDVLETHRYRTHSAQDARTYSPPRSSNSPPRWPKQDACGRHHPPGVQCYGPTQAPQRNTSATTAPNMSPHTQQRQSHMTVSSAPEQAFAFSSNSDADSEASLAIWPPLHALQMVTAMEKPADQRMVAATPVPFRATPVSRERLRIVEQAAGHLKLEVDYPPSQPAGSGFEPHWRPQPAKLPSIGGYSLETLPYLTSRESVPSAAPAAPRVEAPHHTTVRIPGVKLPSAELASLQGLPGFEVTVQIPTSTLMNLLKRTDLLDAPSTGTSACTALSPAPPAAADVRTQSSEDAAVALATCKPAPFNASKLLWPCRESNLDAAVSRRDS